ncbi:hypothetical protein GS399_03040 [Pedobacter sp. HMF7647]|uniref:Uncharacterized protein n=1 Tax=Hufsiella arboris TaxID=2695275 RepID=A0A7K1Y5T5_9SPHI|nr:hypothetical protein [Hufsiella arboris]MXV49933.1 hypothetical protein [Hufsiella arboris]
MDIPIPHGHKSRFRFIKEFEYIDLFPYSICLISIIGEIYLIHLVLKITESFS